MRTTLRALSALLGYPTAELQAAAAEIRAALRADRALPRERIDALDELLARLATQDLMELQAEYTGLFDGSRSRSLHLFEHVHGESRDRGAALVDLAGQYMQHGFYIDGHELPDFLPLFVEFLSFLAPAEAKEWLARPAHVLAALEERLAEGGSPYAAVFAALRVLPGRAADPAAVAELRTRMREEDARSVDERWADEPVTFGPPQAPAGSGKTGIVARIQMHLRR